MLAGVVAASFSIAALGLLSRFDFDVQTTAGRFALLLAMMPLILLGVVNHANLLGVDPGGVLTIAAGPGGLVRAFQSRAAVALWGNLVIVAVALPVGIASGDGRYLPVLALQLGLGLLIGIVGVLTSAFAPVARSYHRVSAPTTPISISMAINLVGGLFILGAILLLHVDLGPAARLLIATLVMVASGAAWWLAYTRLIPRLLRARGETILSALREPV
jgi:hypothetical protein